MEGWKSSHFDMENIYVKSHWHVSKWKRRDGEINFDDIFGMEVRNGKCKVIKTFSFMFGEFSAKFVVLFMKETVHLVKYLISIWWNSIKILVVPGKIYTNTHTYTLIFWIITMFDVKSML